MFDLMGKFSVCCCFSVEFSFSSVSVEAVSEATASGIQKLLVEYFAKLSIDLVKELVSLCVNGAAVNLGVRRSLLPSTAGVST